MLFKRMLRALYLLKNAGFKVLCHFMSNLPGATPKTDIKMFDTIIDDSDYDCDGWKISSPQLHHIRKGYWTGWYCYWKVDEGKYIPYPNEEPTWSYKACKAEFQRHKRISRILRYTGWQYYCWCWYSSSSPGTSKKVAAEGDYCKCVGTEKLRILVSVLRMFTMMLKNILHHLAGSILIVQMFIILKIIICLNFSVCRLRIQTL